MSAPLARLIAIVSSCLPLVGCAGYVDEFSSRVNNGDEAYNRSIADGVLNNILRAGYSEPISFVGLGKYTGTSNSTLSGAIPGFTLSKDPLQIAVTGFSAKEDTDAQIEATVLNTRNFVKGMSSTIDLGTFKGFIDQGYPRELLLYLFVNQIRITDATSGEVTVLRNDPSLDVGLGCERHDYTDYANRMAKDRDRPAEYGPIRDRRDCEFHQFQYWVEEAMRYGFNIDFPDPPDTPAPRKARPMRPPAVAPKSPSANDEKKDAAPTPTGRVCYDLGLMSGDTAGHLRADPGNLAFGRTGMAKSPICGSKPSTPPDKTLTLGEALPFEEGGRKTSVHVSPELRSPAAVFRYVGRLVTNRSFEDTELFERAAVTPTDHRLLAVDQGRTDNCYAVAVHYGVPFCVPLDSPNTKATIAILANLVQLNTNRDDLPTNTTTVNIAP